MLLSEALTNNKVKVKQKKGSYIIYEGKSKLTNDNIVAILTLSSKNEKTGNMAQLWILNADLNPIEASKQGKDDSICGQCPLRRSLNGACYVNLGQAPLNIYKSYKRGSYKKLDIENYNILDGLYIRFGAYGDPFAIPIHILNELKKYAKNNTSYTYQWRSNDSILKSLSMASVDNVEEQKEAVKMGWRTFRIANENSEILKNEIVCPNITKGINCIDCGLCNGASSTKNIVVPVHGSWKKRFSKN